jgi:SAM-dependent methyltransferase
LSFEFEARFFCGLLSEEDRVPERVLIVGCGSGVEARHIAAQSGATVIGLDVDEVRAAGDGEKVHLLRADARRMPFRDAVFDAVYCYHVLEHVPGPQGAVEEARRVIKPASIGFFGTPNKSRLIGYAGGRASLLNKIRWNLVDYGKRLTGRWSNEKGAHAGFKARELEGLVGGAFEDVQSASLRYYLSKYPQLATMWKVAFKLGLGQFIAPSVYVRAASRNGTPGTGGA